jgi:hypothetical protein
VTGGKMESDRHASRARRPMPRPRSRREAASRCSRVTRRRTLLGLASPPRSAAGVGPPASHRSTRSASARREHSSNSSSSSPVPRLGHRACLRAERTRLPRNPRSRARNGRKKSPHQWPFTQRNTVTRIHSARRGRTKIICRDYAPSGGLRRRVGRLPSFQRTIVRRGAAPARATSIERPPSRQEDAIPSCDEARQARPTTAHQHARPGQRRARLALEQSYAALASRARNTRDCRPAIRCDARTSRNTHLPS